MHRSLTQNTTLRPEETLINDYSVLIAQNIRKSTYINTCLVDVGLKATSRAQRLRAASANPLPLPEIVQSSGQPVLMRGAAAIVHTRSVTH